MNIKTGLFEDADGGWNGGDDSFYEYLLKVNIICKRSSQQLLRRSNRCTCTTHRDLQRTKTGMQRLQTSSCFDLMLTVISWVLAADSSIAHLASHPSSRPDLTFLAAFSNQTLNLESGHLACFDGGNFILGGLVLNEQKYIDFGLELVEACEDLYNSTLTGIGPESFSWNATSLTAANATRLALYQKAGFYITDNDYILRPEVIESFYYAYRATGSQVYQDVSVLCNLVAALKTNTT